MESIVIKTEKEGLYNITSDIQKMITAEGIGNGCCLVFCPHTTAAVTINENADADVQGDILHGLHKISPSLPAFQHAEGNSAAHIKSSLVGVSEMIAVENGRLLLGTWQGVYFCEFDGPRTRKVYVTMYHE